MPENWDAYLANFDNKIASFFVNLGLRTEAPMETHPWAVFVRLKLLTPRENGLTQNEEFNVLNGVEDVLVDSFKSMNAIYAGRMTTDGKRLSVFYATAQPDTEQILKQVRNRFPEYTFEAWSSEEPDWHFYTCTLYPREEEMQVLQNRKVLDNLRQHGDTLEQTRPVDHCVYFDDAQKRYEFIAAVQPFGYKADCVSDEQWQPRPHRVVVTRVDRVNQPAIDEAVLQLFRLANHYDGEYDGWGTTVVSAARPAAPKPWWKKLVGGQ